MAPRSQAGRRTRPGPAWRPALARASAPGGISEREEFEFLRDLVGGMRCGVLSIDRQGRLIRLNEPAQQILELSDPPPPGVPVERALREHRQLAQILRESFSMSSLPNRAEIDLHFPPDRNKTIGFTLSLVAGESGPPYGAALFFRDLTRVEQREEQERLRDRLAALGQMAANMAHEIRNPLASIEVSCSLLKRRLPADAPEAELVDKIVAEVARLETQIGSSLEYVRPLSLELALGDVTRLLEEALHVAERRRGRPDIRVVRRLAPGIPPMLIDRARLRQVFVNLLLNGFEAMDGEGMLTLESAIVDAPGEASVPYLAPTPARATDPWVGFERYVQIRIRDTGTGISEEHQDKLFYPFFTTKKNGSGVGLPMAEKIVHSHRGLLDVESRPGAGAAFTVRLPLVTALPEG